MCQESSDILTHVCTQQQKTNYKNYHKNMSNSKKSIKNSIRDKSSIREKLNGKIKLPTEIKARLGKSSQTE